MTIQQFKSNAIKTLSETSPSAALDVSVLLEFCLKKNKTWLLINAGEELSGEQAEWLPQLRLVRTMGLSI